MDNEYKLNNFAALEPETKNKEDAKIKMERAEIKQAISECTTKIMNTTSFRKLAGKTQVILSLSGPDVRTRLTHTIEVAKIAKDICIRLGLNADLAEAIALAHDIGHTPFGHVGERTLREIMCGCDTLGGKVRDCDFDNSGFKHNLQSFRVLKDLECVDINSNGDSEYQNIWPYIFWGALAHTKMTYAKAYSGMDNEILISSKHCDWVYVCHYDEKKVCKRNIQQKKRKEVNNKEICKPWYCAMLPVIKDRDEVNRDYLDKNETRREHVKKEPIEEKYLDWIYCSHKCYLAKLWKHKITSKSTPKSYPYLFDHPFPNSFYAKPLYDYFNNSDEDTHQDFFSFESQIVRQADEIAQRQQDLEDGINKGLLPFTAARKQVKELIEKFNYKGMYKKELEDLDNNKNSEHLGKFLADFYKKAIISQTQENVKDFVYNKNKVKINIYSLMNILYSMYGENGKKTKWILMELNELTNPSSRENEIKIDCFKNVFRINFSRVYLYLLSYDHLEKCTKRTGYTKDKDRLNILSECISLLNSDLKERIGELCEQISVQAEELCKLKVAKSVCKLNEELLKLKNNNCDDFKSGYIFLKILDLLRDYLFEYHKIESDDFFKMEKKGWKTIGWLKLRCFYSLYQVFKENSEKNNGKIISISDLKDFNSPTDYNPEDHAKKTFKIWKKVLKDDANKVLSNLVTFSDENNSDDKRGEALDDFEEKQSNIILKSEPVEKNDGKASYMLRRMFKAYIDNSHQLPDLGLKYILTSLIKKEKLRELLKSEKEAFREILDNLKKTMINNTQNDIDVKTILKSNLLEFKTNKDKFEKLKKGKSNEIKAALEKRKKLSEFIKKLEKERGDINKYLKSNEEDNEEDDDKKKKKGKNYIKEQLIYLRAILDNPILNATPCWKSILTRGICDYIASLTDQEAINEYEKLYAGIMELV